MAEEIKEYQHTIAKEVSYSGIGLHSGKDVLMTLKPAAQEYRHHLYSYRPSG